ncbi:MerR family transcriptional regulator [Streptomyces sp. NBC_01508]|uniref:MerR family transcriptional regulator n=1 Tax=Streptomyces sp. NBC_01508 TaxID=2903888 RepID=UPI00386BE5E5
MRIGDAAASAGLTPRALRYYEQEGLLRARRMSSGHREYGPEDVHRLRAVRRLLEAGLTISDVKAFVDVLDMVFPADGEAAGPGPDPGSYDRPGHCPVAEVTARRLAALDERIEGLDEVRSRLADALAHRFGEVFPDRSAAPGADRVARPAARPGATRRSLRTDSSTPTVG